MAEKMKDSEDCSFKTYIYESVADNCSSEEKKGENDAPVVFMCGKCKLPIGDSLSWAGSDEEQNQIILKRTTNNIVKGIEPFVSCPQKELGCLVVNLTCNGCGSKLGIKYISTPKSLITRDHFSAFPLKILKVGSSRQQMPELDRQDRPVTLEYQDILQQQMTVIKSLVVLIGQRLLEIETKLRSSSGK